MKRMREEIEGEGHEIRLVRPAEVDGAGRPRLRRVAQDVPLALCPPRRIVERGSEVQGRGHERVEVSLLHLRCQRQVALGAGEVALQRVREEVRHGLLVPEARC